MQLITDLSQYDNRSYSPGRGRLWQLAWYGVNALVFANPLFPFVAPKRSLLRWFGARVGQGLIIKPKVNIKYPWRLHIADHVWIGEEVWIDNLDRVDLHSHVCLSQGALLLCGNHNYKSPGFELITGPITLHAGVWIGAKAVVGPGVVAHSHAVLAVGSVATTSLDAYGIYRGNPACKVNERRLAGPPGTLKEVLNNESEQVD